MHFDDSCGTSTWLARRSSYLNIISRFIQMGAQEIEPKVDGEFADDDETGLFTIPGYRFTCPYSKCGLQFKRKDQLDSHEYVHTKRKKFQCTENNCDKSYVNNSHLQRHIRTFHPTCPPKPKKVHKFQYHCDYCSEEFYRKFHLRMHIVTHTGHYPYKCVQCDKGFIRNCLLKQHEKTHKSRKCDQCDAVFPKWSQLVAHKRKEHVTTEWKCMQCNRVFYSKRCLSYHQKVHVETEEQTVYQCDFDKCPKFFFHRRNLAAHRKSKHGNQKFACSVNGCGSELSTKQKLDLHMRTVHSVNGEKIKTDANKSKARAPRKDKGVQKTSTAARLLGLIAPKEIEKAIIAGHGDSVYFHYDHTENDASEDLSSEDKCSSVRTQSQMMEMVQA